MPILISRIFFVVCVLVSFVYIIKNEHCIQCAQIGSPTGAFQCNIYTLAIYSPFIAHGFFCFTQLI